MARCAIISPKNVISGISIKANNTTSGASTALLNRNYRGAWYVQNWATGSGASFTLYGSLTSGTVTADTFAILRNNLPSTAKVRIYLYAGVFTQGVEPSGTAAFTSALLNASTSGLYTHDGYADLFYKHTSAVTFGSFRVVVSTLPESGTANIFGLHFGMDLALSRGFSMSAGFRQIDGTEYARTISGGTIVKKLGNVSRTLTMPFELMTGDDRKALANAERAYRGNSWLVIAYPDGEDWQKLEATFLALPEIGNYGRSGHGLYNTGVMIMREI